ncbi:MAG: ferritin [Cytophagales bacterium]|nr:ferritin [Cytophagales bacterium]
MKKIITLKRSLTEETESLLNQQITMEGISSAHYLAMASWCDRKGYDHSAKFLYHHSEEERTHMLKLVHYINDVGGHALQPKITPVKQQFNTLRAIFDSVLTQEINVTKSIYDLADHCLSIKDFGTFNFLQWFITEQREEEMIARRALELFDIIGEEGMGLYMIDQEIGKLAE